MPEVIINGPDGRLECKYQPGREPNAPIALMLHPHPQHGGTMNNKVVYNLHYAFYNMGFTVLRFNFRGVGRSQGVFDQGIGELSDAASALDWMQTYNANARATWVAGYSFGSWIGMQLLMRRPEIGGFLSIGAPANLYDFSFLAPCPSSGLFLHGADDNVVPTESVEALAEKLAHQREITIDYRIVEGADHFFNTKVDEMTEQLAEWCPLAKMARF